MTLQIGTNPCAHDDWTLPIFQDLRLNLRVWGSPDAPYDYNAAVHQSIDANGYPTVSFGGYSDCKIGPGGDYILAFTGAGQFSCSMGMQLVETLSPTSFRVRCLPKSPVAFKILNPQNFNNLTILPVGYTGGTFTPAYLDSFKPFPGPIRCMDLARTNNSKQVKWTDRALPGHLQTVEVPQDPIPANYVARGLAIEYLIELANTVDRPLWLCIPHLADDSWLDGLADLLANNYKGTKPILIEWGNENWNGQFRQYAELSNAAAAVGKDLFGYVISRLHTAALKLRFKDVPTYGVLAGQQSNAGLLRDALKANPDAPQFIGALATANYFLGDASAEMTAWVDKSIADVAAHRALADEFKIKDLFAYEGGQYVTGAGKDGIQRDPQMGDQYRRLYTEGFKAGLTGACHYNHVGPWMGGMYWAAKENYDDVTPKWAALVELSGGTVTPVVVPPVVIPPIDPPVVVPPVVVPPVVTPPVVDPPVVPPVVIPPTNGAKITLVGATVTLNGLPMHTVPTGIGCAIELKMSNGRTLRYPL